MQRIFTTMICFLVCAIAAQAQGRGGNDWMTDNADAQRTATIKVDSKINRDSVAKPDAVQFLWKLKLKNTPNQLNNLSTPATLERLIGYKGFRMLGFIGGSGDNIITIDTDLGRLEYEKKLPTSSAASAGTLACPGGMTTGIVRPTTSMIAAGGGGGFGPGRNTPAKSTVGEAWEGAANLKDVRQGPPPGPPPTAQQAPPRPNQPPMGGGFGGGAQVIYALASDGMLHSMHLSGGQEFQPAVKFLPPGANANGLIIVNGKAFAVTTNSCNGVANGLWAYDFEAKQTATWKGDIVGSVGAAFGGDGTAYVATANGVTAIDPKTLQAKGAYTASGQQFSSSPVVFEFKGKTMIAAATKTGSVHLLDAANLSAAVATTPAGKDAAPGALASWQDASGTRWILAATDSAVVAWKAVEQGGGVSLQPGWTSRVLVSPLTPTIINGVVFATSSGEFRTNDSKVTAAQRAARSKPAVIYALDGTTGKELWNSGMTIKSFARGNALSGGMGQFYLTTHDGMLYAFGFPMEH